MAMPKKKHKKTNRRLLSENFMQPGFTIVELLIVVVVIGVLAGLTVTGYRGIQERSKNATRIQAASQLAKAMYSVASTDGNLGVGDGRFCLSDRVPDINSDGVKDCGEVANPAKPATYNQALIDKLKLFIKILPQGEPVTTWSFMGQSWNTTPHGSSKDRFSQHFSNIGSRVLIRSVL